MAQSGFLSPVHLADDLAVTFFGLRALKVLSILGYVMMVGGLLGLLAMRNLFFSSPLIIGVLVLAGAVARIVCEEKLVTKRYPEYSAYATRTWRMVPYVF